MCAWPSGDDGGGLHSVRLSGCATRMRSPSRVHTLLTLCLPSYSSVPSHVRVTHAHTTSPTYMDFVLEPISFARLSKNERHTDTPFYGTPARRVRSRTPIFAIANQRAPFGRERKCTRGGRERGPATVEGKGTRMWDLEGEGEGTVQTAKSD